MPRLERLFLAELERLDAESEGLRRFATRNQPKSLGTFGVRG
ncbi:hypothetical protein RISK_006037 [Rhodopirellula islandica]|uniref:Uncharacterized protein n=1 Tax=Rhodopirellula islandica TaxID=595434 RepID=A0A0J1B5G9_RHOIS|nr:hypothetical protein RISK_006037 [Rhodopirellula islandica]